MNSNPPELPKEFKGIAGIQQNVLLAPYTYFKVGGPAKYFYKPSNIAEFIQITSKAKQSGIKHFILGGGANILVSDKGYDGLVIKSGGHHCQIIDGDKVKAESAVPLSQLINQAISSDLSGLEFLAGIPGTVGGAIYGNAGGTNLAIGDRVIEVKIINHDGNIKLVQKADCGFGYRTSRFKKTKEIVIEAILGLTKGGRRQIQSEVNQKIADKKN